jgi:toxin HigB-1
MIISFLHKGLENFFLRGKTQGVKQDHVKRLRVRLNTLHEMQNVNDLKLEPSLKFHQLKGELRNHYSIWVSGNWRLIFKWDDVEKNVEVLDYLDYH